MPKQFTEYEDLPIKPCEGCWVNAEECSRCYLLSQEEYEWQVEVLDREYRGYISVSNPVQLEGG